VVVLGYVVRGPLGGLAWHHLQYVLGLAALGHDVVFLEDSEDYPACYDPSTHSVGTSPVYGLAFIDAAFRKLGLGAAWAYFDAHEEKWHGPAGPRFRGAGIEADVLLNVSGVNPLREWTRAVPRRVLIDTDPAFTQIRHITDPAARSRAGAHTHFYTFGENFGRTGCAMPDDGFPWRPTRQPVALERWPVAPPAPAGPLTTVMQWDSYQVLRHAGTDYGMKSASFPPYLDLPASSGRPFRLAVGSETAPREELSRHGWEVADPLEVTRDPWTYQDFVAGSRAEWSVAKAGYVTSRCGWFSERSAAYLASGRPVVVQDTGFSEWLAPSAGVLPFSTPEEALVQIDRLDHDYPARCRAARAVAEGHFDARQVLGRMLDEVLG
jgi:hypothetical protein